MESIMCKAMKDAWTELYKNQQVHPNLIYEKGFESCHDILMPLLIEAMPHVLGSHGAEHMLDGFRPQRRLIDDLVERIKAVLPE